MVAEPRASAREVPTVSVLLPAWNEAAMLGRCLDSLLAIDWPGLEIVVCAGGSDGTLEIARSYAGPRVTVLEQHPGEGKEVALRRCFAASHGEIIYLTDADCIVPEDAFRAVIAPLVDGEADAATGTSAPPPEQRSSAFTFYQWSIVRAVERRRPRESTGLLGRNCAVRREALMQTGAFGEPVPIGTDYHLAKMLMTIGRTIVFVPAAVMTPYQEDARGFLRKQSRWLRNIFAHGPRFRDRGEIIACSRTVALGAGFFAWPLGWRWTRGAGITVWLAAFAYLIQARLRYSTALARETGLPLEPAYLARLPWYTLLDVAAWAWPIVDLVQRRERRW